MLPDHDRLTYLFHKYLQDRASGEEMDELFAYIRESKQEVLLEKQITEVFRKVQQEESLGHVDWDEMFSRIIDQSEIEETKPKTRGRKVRLWRSVAAAVIIFALAWADYHLYLKRTSPSQYITQSQNTKNDILPGGNKATLILSNGTKIILDSANSGKLATQGNTNVVKMNSGLLAYSRQGIVTGSRSSTHGGRESVQYNTLTTPRGGQYNLILSDGTKVWLNAASSIRYPTAFSGKERKVEITGEVYFEVAKDAAMPFLVQKGNMEIKVLGTHFNVDAYDDEAVEKVTLLEGLINVSQLKTDQSLIVHPDQQVQLDETGQIKLVKNVDVADVVAWKNGFFTFRNDNLQSVMRKLSRWYDVDVTYQPGVNNEQEFSGKIDRSLTLSQVLNGLEQTRAHFRIESNRKVEILR